MSVAINAPGSSTDHAGLLGSLRERSPLVQCLTNVVVSDVTANALLAIGAAPAMVDVPGEAGAMAGVADAVLVNLGTPAPHQQQAMLEAAEAAVDTGTPWVLDPVAVGSLPVRTRLAHELLAIGPTVVRGNPSEIRALAGLDVGGRGVDSTASVDEATEAAVGLAAQHGAVVAVSGAVDVVTDGERTVRVANGDELLTRMTGGGCALGAVVAAYAGLGGDPVETTVAAVAAYGVAAERAAETAGGPGSFAVALLDRLADLDAETLAGVVRVS
jgi:hydroxyethylthiazole kinase